MKRAKNTKRSPLRIPAIILAVIVVGVFLSASYQIRDSSEGNTYDFDARNYIYPAENERFGDLYDIAVRDMGKKATYIDEVKECRALAFYYEQAVLEHAYRVAGDDAKADKFAARMDEYAEQLGSMSAKAAAVRESISG